MVSWGGYNNGGTANHVGGGGGCYGAQGAAGFAYAQGYGAVVGAAKQVKQRPRTRLTQQALSGRVLEWKGQYGWILPYVAIRHPQVDKHKGRIYVHASDVRSQWGQLQVGSVVEFFLYDDGNGLGAEECAPRKVVRVMMEPEEAKRLLGEQGEGIQDLEDRLGVALRAYQWTLNDGSGSFLMIEVWGGLQSATSCAMELALETGNNERKIKILIPESRCWKLDLANTQEGGATTELSEHLALTDPMACHSLVVQGSAEQLGKAVRSLLTQLSG